MSNLENIPEHLYKRCNAYLSDKATFGGVAFPFSLTVREQTLRS